MPASTQKETPEKYSGITLYPDPNENTCPAKSTGGSGSSLGQLYTSRATARVSLNSSTLILNIWKDGGNIELGEEVAATLPWDAYEMFNDLMGNSPYLSEEVLISAIENTAFSSLMIKLLMIANPHSTRSDEVMSALYERNPPLPETYIQEITGELGTVSQLDLLKADVAADRHMYNNLGEQIKRLYRSDTTHAWAMDSLLNFLGQDDQLGSRYELAFVQLESGYPALALSTLDEIPSQFDLNESEQADHDDFVYLHNIREQMIESSGSTGFLTENQINAMEGMLEANRPQVAAIAAALLCKNDPELVYNEIVLEPDTNSVPKRIIAVREKIKEPLFKLYPNPAYSQVIIAYDVSDKDYRLLKTEIYNIQGKLVMEKILDVKALQARIDLHHLSPGKYFVRLVGDGRILGTEKLSIGR